MVQLWYPADRSDRPFAPYAPTKEAAALQKFYPVPAGAFSVATHSRTDAPVRPGRYPVVFFHHGLCGARTDSTTVAEQLASNGYVVVAMGTTREMPAVEFPGGRVVTTSDPKYCTAAANPFTAAGKPVAAKLLDVRVADVRFVADELQVAAGGRNPDADGKPLPNGLGSAVQLTDMGMYGHSFGGATSAEVLLTDRRFRAGIDLDGFVLGQARTKGLAKPFLVIGAGDHNTTLDPSWKTFLPTLSGWHRWIQVNDAGHYRFIDLGGSAHRWGLDSTLKKQDPTTWRQVFGDIPDATSQRITRDLVVGFFGQFLKNQPAAVLTRPSAAFPDLLDRTRDIDTPAAAGGGRR